MRSGCRGGVALSVKWLASCLAAVVLSPAFGEADDAALCLGANESADLSVAHCTAAIDGKELADGRRAASSCFTV